MVSSLEDALDEYNDETYSYPYQCNDRDWTLLNNSSDLPSIDFEDAKFFEDANACIFTPSLAIPSRTPAEGAETAEDIGLEDESDGTTVHMDDIYESLNYFDARCESDFTSNTSSWLTQQESLLHHWACDYQRHEWIAAKLQIPPYTVTSQDEHEANSMSIPTARDTASIDLEATVKIKHDIKDIDQQFASTLLL